MTVLRSISSDAVFFLLRIFVTSFEQTETQFTYITFEKHIKNTVDERERERKKNKSTAIEIKNMSHM